MEDTKTGDYWKTKDRRADTRTTFVRKDIEKLNVSERRKRQLRRMLRRQEGEQDGEVYSEDYNNREQQNRGEWKRRVASTLSSQLDLTDAQKERVTYVIKEVLDINTFGYYSTEQVVLATINVVAREDGRWIEEESAFRDLMVDVGIARGEYDETPDMNSLKTLRRMVRERLPERNT